ncbi:MAG: glycosyltransferase [Deltaproteobacteria bacterium]|nr:glycosyltransferase [Deltaproteobacteria bacterium]
MLKKKEDMNIILRRTLPFFIAGFIAGLKKWDLKTSRRPDHYIAISSGVKLRIKKIYGIDADVIFPPVDIKKFELVEHTDNFYLIVSRLNSYKKIDLAVKVFNILGIPLKIIGSGPLLGTLKSLARPNVSFLGRMNDREVAGYYAACKPLIFPGEEDAGIVPLEANAAGRPVIAFQGGGALDTIIEGVNGFFFNEITAESLIKAIQSLEAGQYNFQPQEVRAQALRFDKEIFRSRMENYIFKKYEEFKKSGGK